MSFLFRAILVVSVLTYFAAQRQGRPVAVAEVASGFTPSAPEVAQAWNAVPTDTRDRISREAATALAQRIAAMQPSQDTLGPSDRKPIWQGPAAR